MDYYIAHRWEVAEPVLGIYPTFLKIHFDTLRIVLCRVGSVDIHDSQFYRNFKFQSIVSNRQRQKLF